jgi:hypothetical protein
MIGILLLKYIIHMLYTVVHPVSCVVLVMAGVRRHRRHFSRTCSIKSLVELKETYEKKKHTGFLSRYISSSPFVVSGVGGCPRCRFFVPSLSLSVTLVVVVVVVRGGATVIELHRRCRHGPKRQFKLGAFVLCWWLPFVVVVVSVPYA